MIDLLYLFGLKMRTIGALGRNRTCLKRIIKVTGIKRLELYEAMAAFICAGRTDKAILQALRPDGHARYQAIEPGEEIHVSVGAKADYEKARVAVYVWGYRHGRKFSVKKFDDKTLLVKRIDGLEPVAGGVAAAVPSDVDGDGIKFF